MRLVSYGIQLYNLFLSNKKKFLYLPLGLYWLLIFVLTSIPGKSIPKVLGGVDKIKHFGAYFVLAFLLSFALKMQNRYPIVSKYSVLFTFMITLFYGLIDEVHQIFIPGRYFDWMDLLADVIGSLIGIFLAKIIISNNSKNDINLSELS